MKSATLRLLLTYENYSNPLFSRIQARTPVLSVEKSSPHPSRKAWQTSLYWPYFWSFTSGWFFSKYVSAVISFVTIKVLPSSCLTSVIRPVPVLHRLLKKEQSLFEVDRSRERKVVSKGVYFVTILYRLLPTVRKQEGGNAG